MPPKDTGQERCRRKFPEMLTWDLVTAYSEFRLYEKSDEGKLYVAFGEASSGGRTRMGGGGNDRVGAAWRTRCREHRRGTREQ